MNNVACKCNCNLHVENQVHKPEKDQWTKFKQKMLIRVKRTRIIIALIGLICFAFGIAITFLFHMSTKSEAGYGEKKLHHRDFVTIRRQKHIIPSILPPSLT